MDNVQRAGTYLARGKKAEYVLCRGKARKLLAIVDIIGLLKIVNKDHVRGCLNVGHDCSPSLNMCGHFKF